MRKINFTFWGPSPRFQPNQKKNFDVQNWWDPWKIARKQDFHLEGLKDKKKQWNNIHTKKTSNWLNVLTGEEKYFWKFQQTKSRQFMFEVLKHAAQNLEVKAWMTNQI